MKPYQPVYDFRSSGPRKVASYEVSFYWPDVGFDFASMTLPWRGRCKQAEIVYSD